MADKGITVSKMGINAEGSNYLLQICQASLLHASINGGTRRGFIIDRNYHFREVILGNSHVGCDPLKTTTTKKTAITNERVSVSPESGLPCGPREKVSDPTGH